MKSSKHILTLLTLLVALSSAWAAETSSRPMFTISGTIGANGMSEGLAGVAMQGLPGVPLSDENGGYMAQVSYGWSGRVTPIKKGYRFDPPQLQYRDIAEDCVNQNYGGQFVELTISGDAGLEGVVMQGLPGHVVSDPSGYYTAQIPYGWAGTVAPLKQGCTFEPARRRYLKITTDQREDNYTVRGLAVSPPPSFAPSNAEVLVIPTAEIDPKRLAETREDMQVMIHILREMLSEPRTILGMLYDYGDIFGSSDRGTQAFYLEGYGALFVMEVDFPFSFPGEADPNDAPEQEVDPVWQRARQRLRTPGARRAYGQTPGDEMSFEQFKSDLTETLKHAANIRHIDPNENVILTIVGQDTAGGRADFSSTRGAFPGAARGAFGGSSYSTSGGSFGPSGGSTYATSRSYAGGSTAPGAQAPARDPSGTVTGGILGKFRQLSRPAPASTTVLTIQARKADIDAFSAGNINLETFQQHVKVFSY